VSHATIFVCDDEMLIRLWVGEHLEDGGFEVETFERGDLVLSRLREKKADLVLLDLRLPDASGLDILARIREMDPEISVIMMSAYGEVETAVRAVREGAHHFLEKPIEIPELLLLIDQALDARRLASEVGRYREGNAWQFRDIKLVGRSFAMRRVAELVTRLALRGSPTNVLITGESGTGKDVVARAIHARGPRRDRPFINLNCTALPDALVESELFGHEAGAFTDAREMKIGLFELASEGTLFLDEIGDMPKSAQAKLLQVLETGTLRRVGGVRDIPVDVHVVAATNRDLDQAVETGSFREDLFYRINVVPIEVPPLRERPDDIAPLAIHFLDRLCTDMRIPARSLTPDALAALEAHDWPGNARQLRNVLERILLLKDEVAVEFSSLPAEIRRRGGVTPGGMEEAFDLPAGGVDLDEVEKSLIGQALERTEGNKSRAARLLGLSRDTLRYRVEKYGLDDSAPAKHPHRTDRDPCEE
jgi:two-component system, NtrC family, response regulator AtoC